MLRPFVKCVLLLLIAVLASVSIVLFTSRQQPPLPQLELLRLHDCQLPCWIGIVPGQTKIGEALMLLKSIYPYSGYIYSSTYNSYEDIDWLQVKSNQSGIVFSISFNRGEPTATKTKDKVISQVTITGNLETYGDWYTFVGEPQALAITWGNHYAAPNALYYEENVRLTLYNGFENFDINSPYIMVSTLDIYDHLDRIYYPNNVVPWDSWYSSYKDKLIALMLP